MVLVQPATFAAYEATYPLKLHLRYEMAADREYRGEGCTLSLSRAEIIFEARDRLPVGKLVKLRIDWPVKLQNEVSLSLTVYGKTIAGQHTTVQILRHEFRTAAAVSRPKVACMAQGAE